MLSPAQVETLWLTKRSTLLRTAGKILFRFPRLGVDAEDVVQFALLRCLESKAIFREECELTTLMTTIMHNHVVHLQRRQTNFRCNNISLDEVGKNLHDRMPSPFDLAYRKEQTRIFESTADGMRDPEKYKKALRMRLDGYDIDEIAEHIGMNVNTVKVMFHRGRERTQRKAKMTMRFRSRTATA